MNQEHARQTIASFCLVKYLSLSTVVTRFIFNNVLKLGLELSAKNFVLYEALQAVLIANICYFFSSLVKYLTIFKFNKKVAQL